MVKLVFTLHRKSGMSFEEFSRYWRNVHAPIGAALPGVRKYIQNHARATLDGSPLLQRALVSPQGQAAVADSANFLDVARIQTFVVEEVAVV
jgi:uncharacterized protein (TIGR02118 family)